MFNKEKYLNKLALNREQLFAQLQSKNLDVHQKLTPDTWSILEIAEHIYKVDLEIYSKVYLPSEKTIENGAIFGEDKINKIVVDLRNRKVVSPEDYNPSGLFTNVDIAVKHLDVLFKKWHQDISENKIVIDSRIIVHPHIGDMTISDVLHFGLAHCERHILQINDIIKELK
jgi:DinB superfamily